MKGNAQHFTERLPILVTEPFSRAVSRAAAGNAISVSSYVRLAVMAALRRDGVSVETDVAA